MADVTVLIFKRRGIGKMMETTKKLVLAAMFVALGMVLPFVTGQIKEIGDSLLPMHFVIMLCGLICGWQYGGIAGFTLPFLRSFAFGMPPLYPNCIWMSLELATYGLVIGLIYNSFSRKNIRVSVLSLVTAMVSGRIVWGIAKAVIMGISHKAFTVSMFITGGIIDAIPGIIIQLIFIPIIMDRIENRKITDI